METVLCFVFPARPRRARKPTTHKAARRRAGTARSPPARGERRRYVASPSRLEPQNSGAHNPEADMGAPSSGNVSVTMRRTNALRRASPTPAAYHAGAAENRPQWVGRRSRFGRTPPVPYPLPNVPVHVVQTPGVWPSPSNLARHAAGVAAVPSVRTKVGRIAPKAPLRCRSRTGGKLPFRIQRHTKHYLGSFWLKIQNMSTYI